jgi:hypothetical protein
MDNPESIGSRNSIPELMTARNSQITSSQRKAESLKLHTILRKRPMLLAFPARTGLSCSQEYKNGILPLLDYQHVQPHVNH